MDRVEGRHGSEEQLHTTHYFSRPRRLLSTPSGRTMSVDPKAGVDKAAYMTHDGSGIRKALDSYAMVDTKWHAVW